MLVCFVLSLAQSFLVVVDVVLELYSIFVFFIHLRIHFEGTVLIVFGVSLSVCLSFFPRYSSARHSANAITSLPSLLGFSSLEVLDLSHNEISDVSFLSGVRVRRLSLVRLRGVSVRYDSILLCVMNPFFPLFFFSSLWICNISFFPSFFFVLIFPECCSGTARIDMLSIRFVSSFFMTSPPNNSIGNTGCTESQLHCFMPIFFFNARTRSRRPVP